MDYKQIMEKLEKILAECREREEKICVLISGEWGIGKTYSVNKWFEEKKEEYDCRYVSVFGKNDLRQIETDIILNILDKPKVLEELDKKKKFRLKKDSSKVFKEIGFNALKNAVSAKIGVVFEWGELIKNLRIDELEPEEQNNKILCIDDIERLSEEISLKDILGLIERTSKNFNVIILMNPKQIGENEAIFKLYKEKIIDYEFNLDILPKELLKKIAQEKVLGLTSDMYNQIVDTYIEPLIIEVNEEKNKSKRKIDSELNNIRIYKKYIYLLDTVNKQIKHELEKRGRREGYINNSFIRACKECICYYYFGNLDVNADESVSGLIRRIVWKIMRHEEVKTDMWDDALDWELEVSIDIRNLYNLHTMPYNDAKDLIEKVKKKIRAEDIGYFVKQRKVISIYDALIAIINIDIEMEKHFSNIIRMLYQASRYEMYYDEAEWDDYDEWGVSTCDKRTKKFIKEVNRKNKKMNDEEKQKRLRQALRNNDMIELIQNLPKEIMISDKQQIENILEQTIAIVRRSKEQQPWNIVKQLLQHIDMAVSREILRKRYQEEADIIMKRGLRSILDEMDRLEYLYGEIENGVYCEEEI